MEDEFTAITKAELAKAFEIWHERVVDNPDIWDEDPNTPDRGQRQADYIWSIVSEILEREGRISVR